MSRVFTLNTPLGDTLKFRNLSGSEDLSKVSDLRIEAIAEKSDINLKSLLGKPVTVDIELVGGGKRYLNALVTQARLLGHFKDRHYLYEMHVSPWIWLASRRTDFAIYQHKTIPVIVKEVLGKYGYPIEDRLIESYRTWDYCVQYSESDLDFVKRMMEHEGIYFYIEHEQSSHTLVLCDDICAHKPQTGDYATVSFYNPSRKTAPNEEFIHGWIPGQAVNSGGIELNDYDFERPRAPLNVIRNDPRGHGQDAWQRFEFPGGYTDDGKDGRLYARIRLEEEHAKHDCCQGQSNVRGMTPGQKFTMKGCDPESQNREYLVRGCHYFFQDNAYASGDDEVEHQVEVAAHPSTQPFRPERTTDKPKTTGPQTGVVTGPKGQEIYCDKYGRVKVHFFWDRAGTKDENSSCWIRVSNPWASSGFGGIQVPRIGDEVVIDFINGDPNYPLITGRVYNGEKMPPWDLPANATQMGLVSRSSPGGNATTANALRFEDKTGAEEVWLHAEKDQRIEVEHDESHWVGNDRSKTIDGNETVTVHKNRTETVDQDETITIHQNRKERVDLNETISVGQNRTEDVGQNETISIGDNRVVTIGGNKAETIAMAKAETIGLAKALTIGAAYQVSVGAFMNTTVGLAQAEEIGLSKTVLVGKNYRETVGAGKEVKIAEDHSEIVGQDKSVNVSKTITVTAGDSIELICGKSVLRMDKDGHISINGHELAVGTTGEQHYKASGDINMNGSKIKEN